MFVCDRYEKQYMEDVKLKAAENVIDAEVEETSSSVRSERADEISKSKSNTQKSATVNKDLDVFLLGDFEDSDDGPGMICLALIFCYNAILIIQADISYLTLLHFSVLFLVILDDYQTSLFSALVNPKMI